MIETIIHKHRLWLEGKEGGERAYLVGMDLSGMGLNGVDLRGANLSGANLRWADLSGANLRGANLNNANLTNTDLRGADLRDLDMTQSSFNDCVGNGVEVKSLRLHRYNVSYGYGILNIGCETHSYEEWRDFTDEEISKMANGALKWWKEYKPIIMMLIDKEKGDKR